jgi:hypothetical protein
MIGQDARARHLKAPKTNVARQAEDWLSQRTEALDVSVLVVFADAPEKRILRFLKPGFRHCFLLVSGVRAGEWICLDPQSHRVRCENWCYSPIFDPCAYYRAMGHHCVWATYPQSVRRKTRIGPMSCVELVKRVLGIPAFWIVTPWQLYRHLQKSAEHQAIRGNAIFSENVLDLFFLMWHKRQINATDAPAGFRPLRAFLRLGWCIWIEVHDCAGITFALTRCYGHRHPRAGGDLVQRSLSKSSPNFTTRRPKWEVCFQRQNRHVLRPRDQSGLMPVQIPMTTPVPKTLREQHGLMHWNAVDMVAAA